MKKDYRTEATELANLLGSTCVDYHNRNIAIDFISREMQLIEEKIKHSFEAKLRELFKAGQRCSIRRRM